MPSFALHPDLVRDCFEVTDLPVCKVLLRNDARFPWLILVPRRDGLKEWFDLSVGDMEQVNREVMTLAKAMKHAVHADKINIAALGNMTPQLHVHIIARFKSDAAWPNPVWNIGVSKSYALDEKTKMISTIHNITKM